MNVPIVLSPDALRQFPGSRSAFVAMTDAASLTEFRLAPSAYPDQEIVGLEPGAGLGAVMASLPDDADVLVVAPASFVRSTDLAAIGARRVAVMPCGSTPVRLDHIRYFVEVLARTDPLEQAARAAKFFDAVSDAEHITLVDTVRETACTFDPSDDSYVWNQQAGPLEPGEHQLAPAGELSVLPVEITGFDASRRLALTGTLTLRGEPIVHAGYDPALGEEQAALYSSLSALRRHPVAIDVDDGLVTDCRAGGSTPEALRVAATLNELFAGDERYRIVWELGFGINTEMGVVPANCGLNEVYGATDGVPHIGIGLTPFTRFALTFLCPDSTVRDQAGTVLLGKPSSPATGAGRSRIRRVKTANCGCH